MPDAFDQFVRDYALAGASVVLIPNERSHQGRRGMWTRSSKG